MDWKDLNSTIEHADLDFLADQPLVYHCHHFNLFLDQTIDDFFGAEKGIALRTSAARAASYPFLTSLFNKMTLTTPPERLLLAQTLFSAFGHGRLYIDAGVSGGTASGEFLHYGYAWREKYGAISKRQTPADAFAAGYASAAVQAAFDTAHEFTVQETQCYAQLAERCAFTLEAGMMPTKIVPVDESAARQSIQPPLSGLAEDRIADIDAGLRTFLGGVAGAEDTGLVDAFGVFVTRHLPNYYNAISYQLYAAAKQDYPDLLPVAEALLRESGHVCVFNTFGGILYSPEWEAMVGRIEGDLEEVVSSCMAIARALGFGRWIIAELDESHFVLRTGSEYESPFCHVNECAPNTNNAYFVQGAALAIMRLWQELNWKEKPALTQDLYKNLFKSEHHWQVEQTRSLANGDAYTEVVVTKQ